jgi:hypothetical protein
MNRGGVALVVVLVLLSVLAGTALVEASLAARRLRETTAWRARVQARELALGAAALAPGARIAVGHWTVSRQGDALACEGEAGRYEIAADGAERWRPRR